MTVTPPTREQATEEIAKLRAVIATKPRSSDSRPLEAQIEAIEHHMKDDVSMWSKLGTFDKFICYMGVSRICNRPDHYNRHGEALMGKAVHGWFDTPVYGCGCDHCEKVANYVRVACDFMAGLGEPPSVVNVRLEAEAEAEAKKREAV